MNRLFLIYVLMLVSICSYTQIDSTDKYLNIGRWIYAPKIEVDSCKINKPFSGYYIDYRDDSTIICEGNYQKNKKNGEWKFYFKDGVTLFQIINFKNNKPFGIYKEYYENGILKDSTFLEGSFHNRVGYWIRYHDNGQIKYKAYYNDKHKEEGQVLYYYKNGQIEFSYKAVNGLPVGKVKVYHENGELKETIICNEEGEEINRIKEP